MAIIVIIREYSHNFHLFKIERNIKKSIRSNNEQPMPSWLKIPWQVYFNVTLWQLYSSMEWSFTHFNNSGISVKSSCAYIIQYAQSTSIG